MTSTTKRAKWSDSGRHVPATKLTRESHPRGKPVVSVENDSQPDPFLEVRVHRLDIAPSLSGLCVGYEQGIWRAQQFADHVMEWLPEFALRSSEYFAMSGPKAVPFIRRAAKRVYESGKFSRRGEFGELFLHIAIRQVFRSMPAISKIYYKSATNDTVKGFDAVHVVGPPDDLELWLGEAKFFKNIDAAIRDVVQELADHTELDYLRSEFVLIADKIDDAFPHATELKKLLSPNTSLDLVFKRACIPVMLTYDSQCLAGHTQCDQDYGEAFYAEVEANYARFASASLPKKVRVHLFLLPLHTKARLIKALDEKLKTWQKL